MTDADRTAYRERMARRAALGNLGMALRAIGLHHWPKPAPLAYKTPPVEDPIEYQRARLGEWLRDTDGPRDRMAVRCADDGPCAGEIAR